MTDQTMSRTTEVCSDQTQPTRRTVVFLGGPFNCVDRMLRVLAAEFADTDFMRCLSVHDLMDLHTQNRPIPLVILEERDISALLDAPAPFFAAAGKARLVLAYRNPDAAAALLQAAEHDPRLATVSLLPLEVHMEVWISVIRLLLLGVSYVPANLSHAAPARPPENAAPATSSPPSAGEDGANPVLTRREMEVLKLVAIGLQNKNIAAKLNLSEHTVKLHMHHVLSKLGVDNRTGATHWYLRQAQKTPPQP